MNGSRENISDIIYISDRLLERVNSISDYVVTVIEAPAGYGKSTLLKQYYGDTYKKNYFLTCTSSDKKLFYQDLCTAIHTIDGSAGEKLERLGFPENDETIRQMQNIISNIKPEETTYIIIDNYHYVGCESLDNALFLMYERYNQDLKFVISTQGITSQIMQDMVITKKFNHITKIDLEFTEADIKKYFFNCGISIDSKEVKKLYNFSEGWISAIYLQLVYYKENHCFDEYANIDMLMEKALWRQLNSCEKEILMNSCIFNKFSIRQLKYMVSSEAVEYVEELLVNCAFIKYDANERKFYLNGILRRYLISKFQDMLDTERNGIVMSASRWFCEDREYFKAIQAAYFISDFEYMYSIRPVVLDLYSYATKENKKFFMDIISECPCDVRNKNPEFLLTVCFIIIFYNENDFLESVLGELEEYVNESTMSEREKNNVLGEMNFVRSISKYNDLQEMYKYMKTAYDYMKKPSKLLSGEGQWTFGSPSTLCLYYNKSGKLWDVINYFTENISVYYKMTNGHGKGAEAVMKAEALFNTGEVDDAEILCHKAIYMAESREQYSIHLSSLMLLGKIAIYRGDLEGLNDAWDQIEKYRTIKSKKITGYIDNKELVDLSMASLSINLSQVDKLPEWLKDENEIENRLSLLSIGYADIILGKYLIMTNQYTKLLGLSGQFLGIASKYPQVLTSTYTYIYISVANEALGNHEKAVKMLKIALNNVIEDKVYMPFVENFSFIESMAAEVSADNSYKEFIKTVKNMTKSYLKSSKQMIKTIKNNNSYGLTSRELEVAQLAAKRLSNKEIAEHLFIAESTVKSNMKIVFNKLNIKSRTELTKFFQ